MVIDKKYKENIENRIENVEKEEIEKKREIESWNKERKKERWSLQLEEEESEKEMDFKEEQRETDEKVATGRRYKRDRQKERESEVSSRASYLQGPCIHGSALLTTQRPMEGERELRGTWFRHERSSVVVVRPRVERCRVTDLSCCDRVSFSFDAFTWIKF